MKELAAIVFAATAVNHLGLVSAVEKTIGMRLPLFNCPKCLTFWCSLIWLATHGAGVTSVVAISLALAYAALWLELAMGVIDHIYYKIYDKIYSAQSDDEATADRGETDTDGTLSELRQTSG